MLTCPSCGTEKLKGSTIVEYNLTTHYVITKNPATKNPVIKPTGYDNSETIYTLSCLVCGAENNLDDAAFDIAKK